MTHERLRALKMIVGSMAGTSVLLALVAHVVLPEPSEPTSALLQVIPLVFPLATAAAWLFMRPSGDGTTGPVSSETTTDPAEAENNAITALTARTITATGIAQAGTVVLMAVTFMLPLPVMAVGAGLVLGGGLTALVAWPTEASVAQWRQRLVA